MELTKKKISKLLKCKNKNKDKNKKSFRKKPKTNIRQNTLKQSNFKKYKLNNQNKLNLKHGGELLTNNLETNNVTIDRLLELKSELNNKDIFIDKDEIYDTENLFSYGDDKNSLENKISFQLKLSGKCDEDGDEIYGVKYYNDLDSKLDSLIYSLGQDEKNELFHSFPSNSGNCNVNNNLIKFNDIFFPPVPPSMDDLIINNMIKYNNLL